MVSATHASLPALATRSCEWWCGMPQSSSRPMLPPAALNRLRSDSATSWRSEEHTSELQSLMRISYAVFCLKKKKTNRKTHPQNRYYMELKHHPQVNPNTLHLS